MFPKLELKALVVMPFVSQVSPAVLTSHPQTWCPK